MNIVHVLIVWAVTAISLFIISKIPFLGVEIDSPGKAFFSAAILGIVTAVVRPLLYPAKAIISFISFDLLTGLTTFVISVICFALAAVLVEGFRLRNGFISAILGALALTFINNIIYKLLGA
ncbi:MAG: phage holin family protein [Calothrix sp. SM1_7_51]|nr:phage holin family protein [Calothrix sp. SM1_7_51]